MMVKPDILLSIRIIGNEVFYEYEVSDKNTLNQVALATHYLEKLKLMLLDSFEPEPEFEIEEDEDD